LKSLVLNISIVFGLIFFSTTSFIFSQTIDLSKKITIKAKNKSLEEVLSEIEKSADIIFSYSSQIIDVSKKITLKVKNKTLEETLNILNQEADIEFSILEKQIILKPVNKSANQTKNRNKHLNNYTLSGHLYDKESGEVLIGASIYIDGTKYGTITNEYGFYSLTIPEGKYNAMFSFIGYKTTTQEIELTKNIKTTLELDFNNEIIDEVVVEAEKQNDVVEKNQQGEIKLTPKSIDKLTGYVGDIDLIKSLQQFPGIKNYGDGSTLFYVRGGNRDQNLIMIDDAPIFNPSHLLGFLSSITHESVSEMTIYKADFPANIGGRASSVIDIRTKDGNMKHFGGSASLSPFVSSFAVEGPIFKDRVSYFTSVRFSNFGWMFRNSGFKISFTDLNIKLNYKINSNQRLFFTLYSGSDFIGRISTTGKGTYGLSWTNSLFVIRWNKIYSSKIFSNTTFNGSIYEYYMYISKEEGKFWNSAVKNFSLKNDFTYFINHNNTSKFGFVIESYSFNPGNLYMNDSTVQAYIPYVPERFSNQYILYYNHDCKLSKRLSFRAGVRLPIWENTGPFKDYIFDESYQIKDTIAYIKGDKSPSVSIPEPRLNLNYIITKKSSLKYSFNITGQYIHLLTNTVSPFTSFEVWLPISGNLKPITSKLNSLSYVYNTGKFEVSAESFYKRINNQIDYADHAKMLLNPYIEGELRQGKATSYGTELTIKKTQGKLNGWISYTISKTTMQSPGINNDKPYPTFYDRPHDFNIFVSYITEKRWQIGAAWLYSTGAAVTTPTSFYYYQGYQIPVYSSKNNDRLPDYHRLDFTIKYKINKPERRFQHDLTLMIYNVYARLNPYVVNFNKVMNEDQRVVIPSNLYGDYETVPTQTSLSGIIPSITYTLKF